MHKGELSFALADIHPEEAKQIFGTHLEAGNGLCMSVTGDLVPLGLLSSRWRVFGLVQISIEEVDLQLKGPLTPLPLLPPFQSHHLISLYSLCIASFLLKNP